MSLFLGSLYAIYSPFPGVRVPRTSSEGGTRSSLNALRSALTIGGKYLATIPPASTPPHHPDSSPIAYGAVPNDQGGWLYDNVAGDANDGKIRVNCTHTDMKGSEWSGY